MVAWQIFQINSNGIYVFVVVSSCLKKPVLLFPYVKIFYSEFKVAKTFTLDSNVWYMYYIVLETTHPLYYKLTRNKNARHIFPRHFLTVAMIGIICLYMHFVLYIFHTRSLFFKYLHYFRSFDNQCTNCTCTSCAPTTRLFDVNFVFEIALFIEQTTCEKKD